MFVRMLLLRPLRPCHQDDNEKCDELDSGGLPFIQQASLQQQLCGQILSVVKACHQRCAQNAIHTGTQDECWVVPRGKKYHY